MLLSSVFLKVCGSNKLSVSADSLRNVIIKSETLASTLPKTHIIDSLLLPWRKEEKIGWEFFRVEK